jgi:hypothetical protein
MLLSTHILQRTSADMPPIDAYPVTDVSGHASISSYPPTNVRGHDSISTYPPTNVGGHAATSSCPPANVSGHLPTSAYPSTIVSGHTTIAAYPPRYLGGHAAIYYSVSVFLITNYRIGEKKDEKWRELNGVARWRLCCLAYIHHL